MLDGFARKVKGLAINAALKVMGKADKLAYLFFQVPASAIESIVILPASHSVGKAIHGRMEKPVKRGMLYNGTLGGVRVTMCRTGVGSPAVANVMEALAAVKPDAIVRLDYAGSLVDTMPVGSVFMASSAVPGDGASVHYIHAGVEAFREVSNPLPGCPTSPVPDPVFSWLASNDLARSVAGTNRLLDALRDGARKKGIHVEEGPIWTTDGLFTEGKEKVAFWRAAGARAVDMETSLIYLLGALHGLHVAAIHGISDNVITHPPFFELERFDPGIESGIKRAIDVLVAALPDMQ